MDPSRRLIQTIRSIGLSRPGGCLAERNTSSLESFERKFRGCRLQEVWVFGWKCHAHGHVGKRCNSSPSRCQQPLWPGRPVQAVLGGETLAATGPNSFPKKRLRVPPRARRYVSRRPANPRTSGELFRTPGAHASNLAQNSVEREHNSARRFAVKRADDGAVWALIVRPFSRRAVPRIRRIAEDRSYANEHADCLPRQAEANGAPGAANSRP